LWRYLNGKSVCREWAVYEQMLQHMSERNRVALPRERLREIQTLWRRAVIRAGELRAERRAGGPVPSVVERGQPEDRPRTQLLHSGGERSACCERGVDERSHDHGSSPADGLRGDIQRVGVVDAQCQLVDGVVGGRRDDQSVRRTAATATAPARSRCGSAHTSPASPHSASPPNTAARPSPDSRTVTTRHYSALVTAPEAPPSPAQSSTSPDRQPPAANQPAATTTDAG